MDVIPAQAGISNGYRGIRREIPACAGMTLKNKQPQKYPLRSLRLCAKLTQLLSAQYRASNVADRRAPKRRYLDAIDSG